MGPANNVTDLLYLKMSPTQSDGFMGRSLKKIKPKQQQDGIAFYGTLQCHRVRLTHSSNDSLQNHKVKAANISEIKEDLSSLIIF